MFEYRIAEGAKVFIAGRWGSLPCVVTVYHQFYGLKVSVVDRAGMTVDELEGFED